MPNMRWFDAVLAEAGETGIVYGGNGFGAGYRYMNAGTMCNGSGLSFCDGTNAGTGLGLMLGYGDGTEPRPLDCTGFGSPSNR